MRKQKKSLEDNGETFAEDVKEKTTKEHLNEADRVSAMKAHLGKMYNKTTFTI